MSSSRNHLVRGGGTVYVVAGWGSRGSQSSGCWARRSTNNHVHILPLSGYQDCRNTNKKLPFCVTIGLLSHQPDITLKFSRMKKLNAPMRGTSEPTAVGCLFGSGAGKEGKGVTWGQGWPGQRQPRLDGGTTRINLHDPAAPHQVLSGGLGHSVYVWHQSTQPARHHLHNYQSVHQCTSGRTLLQLSPRV